jgi:NTE family protein
MLHTPTQSGASSIALALSGGGIRAMVFHLGVLRFLAEQHRLEHVQKISTVSGGSLLVGLIFQEAGSRWPSSEEFLLTIYPSLRAKLCQWSLQWGALRQLLRPWNIRFFLSRANLLALALKSEWGVIGKLADLPATPEWSINGTTAETGKRFRFKHDSIGDYLLGYAPPGDFPLASALAVSAALPGGFGPLTLNTGKFGWRIRPWDAPLSAAVPVKLGFKRLRLYDGGVYDNLGLEPFFDAGKGESKVSAEFILVSDAGAPLRPGFTLFALNPWRLKRVADIMSGQAHALRARTFWRYLKQSPDKGAYVYIDTAVTGDKGNASAAFSSNFPTTLRKLKTAEFDTLASHGYKVAEQTLTPINMGYASEKNPTTLAS